MKDIIVIGLFYLLLVLGSLIFITAVFRLDLLLTVIGIFFIIGAFLLKQEFRVTVLFWKEKEKG